MQHFKDPQLRGGWFFYGPYCIKSLESSLLQSTLSTTRGLFFSLSTVETNSSFVSTLFSSLRLIQKISNMMLYYVSIVLNLYNFTRSKIVSIDTPSSINSTKTRKWLNMNYLIYVLVLCYYVILTRDFCNSWNWKLHQVACKILGLFHHIISLTTYTL